MPFTYLKRQAAALMGGDPYQYKRLPNRTQLQWRMKDWVDHYIRAIRLGMVLLLSCTMIMFAVSIVRSTSGQPCTGNSRDRHCRKEISQSWGQYSSSFSVPSKISPAIPKDCKVTFAQVLSRHGARDPTEHKSSAYASVIDKIHDNVTSYGQGFKFLKHFKYTLGADQLTTLGKNQMIHSGTKFYERYQSLASVNLPFVRASGQERVEESASKWALGFHKARLEDNIPDAYPYNIQVIPEESGFNNTLSPDICPAFEDGKHDNSDEQDTWINHFVPALTTRLNENLPGANLSDEETIYMMDLCPFSTVANEKGKLSEFCYMFSVNEWHEYDYYQSLGKWYDYGNGSPLGPTQGVGFVNELLARLTGKPVVDHTTHNSTLEFPLDRVLYADFSHDNDMMGVFAALGLYNLTDPLPGDRMVNTHKTKGFSASWVVPFAARLYVEKMSCGGNEEEFVRILVNDRVIPLQNCDADEFGRCTLTKFVESQGFARGGGHWDQCFV